MRNLHTRTARGDDDDEDEVDVDNSIITAGPKVDKFDDADDRAFSSEWLPSFKELSSCFVDAWSDRERKKKHHFNSSKGGVAPTMITPGAPPSEVTCYGCGETGHRRGDPECAAGPNAIWEGPDQVEEPC